MRTVRSALPGPGSGRARHQRQEVDRALVAGIDARLAAPAFAWRGQRRMVRSWPALSRSPLGRKSRASTSFWWPASTVTGSLAVCRTRTSWSWVPAAQPLAVGREGQLLDHQPRCRPAPLAAGELDLRAAAPCRRARPGRAAGRRAKNAEVSMSSLWPVKTQMPAGSRGSSAATRTVAVAGGRGQVAPVGRKGQRGDDAAVLGHHPRAAGSEIPRADPEVVAHGGDHRPRRRGVRLAIAGAATG